MSDFQGSDASHEGGRKLLARKQLSGEEEKRAQMLLLLLAGSCLLPEPGKLHGSSVQEEFPLALLGTSLGARTKPGLFDCSSERS